LLLLFGIDVMGGALVATPLCHYKNIIGGRMESKQNESKPEDMLELEKLELQKKMNDAIPSEICDFIINFNSAILTSSNY
jgi:hypothetical protein